MFEREFPQLGEETSCFDSDSTGNDKAKAASTRTKGIMFNSYHELTYLD